MNPLICFYRDGLYLYSEDYRLYRCAPGQSVSEFLNAMASDFHDALKVVQVNFEYDDTPRFAGQKPLYPADSASVLVVQSHELLPAEELPRRLPGLARAAPGEFRSLESRENFVEKVKKIRGEIAAGRLYQVNLTAPLVADGVHAESTALFAHYLERFRGEYQALLPLAECDLLSFSPELFLQKTGGRLITRPIKGSLPAGHDFAAGLLASPKENAELSMIVDLLRNDLNRLSERESAKVTAHRARLPLGYIEHTYSEIEILTGAELPAVLQATAPGGSISGCPKMESLQLIAELEEYRRQAYTGTLGWWQGHDFCLNLTIRSFIRHQERLIYHSGCGIVYESDPEAEWNEYLLKTGRLNVR